MNTDYWVGKYDVHGVIYPHDGPHDTQGKAEAVLEMHRDVNKVDRFDVISVTRLTDKPVEWDGKGLPPVGCVCNFATNPRDEEGYDVTIRYSSKDNIVFTFEDGSEGRIGGNKSHLFTPIKTEADRIDSEVDEVCEFLFGCTGDECPPDVTATVRAIVEAKFKRPVSVTLKV